MKLIESGVDYCRSHHGIRNEDGHRCDCLHGATGDSPGDALDDCELCDDEGVTLCDLTPLLFEVRS